MEAFLARVVVAAIKLLVVGKANATNDEVNKAIRGMIRDSVEDATRDIRTRLDDIQNRAIDRVDAMDGKMGNLQEQLAGIPGQIVKSVIDGVVKALNPFGPR